MEVPGNQIHERCISSPCTCILCTGIDLWVGLGLKCVYAGQVNGPCSAMRTLCCI